jgi:hypothetical protein
MKTNRLNPGRLITCLTALVAVVALAPVRADDGKGGGGNGKYDKITATWWQWAYAQPAVDVDGTNTNPLLDSTGEYAATGQADGIGPDKKYFFLAGTFGGDVERTVTVPQGKTLFIPVLITEVDNAVDPPTNLKAKELKALAKASIDTVTSTYARLDGNDLDIFRSASPTFSYTLPDENSIYDYFGLFGPQFEGTVNPVASDGYWVVIPPLPAGEYDLEFGGANSNGFSLDVIYHLTIPQGGGDDGDQDDDD